MRITTGDDLKPFFQALFGDAMPNVVPNLKKTAADKNTSYWQARLECLPNLERFFLMGKDSKLHYMRQEGCRLEGFLPPTCFQDKEDFMMNQGRFLLPTYEIVDIPL